MAKRELSGKAINLMQNQGMTAHGVIFDNYFFAHQTMGEMLLSLMEQFYDKQKEIRITGDQHKDEFVEINKMNDDGTIQNSITASKADFIVGKQDYRETIRIAMLEQFIELVNTVGKVSPEVSLALLDLVVELMDDLPNKDEAVARIRQINKQHAPEDEMSQEEKVKQYQQDMQDAQEMQAMKQLQQALLQIQVSEGQSKVAKNKAEAAMKKLEGFLKALEAAGTIDAAPHLVEAADAIVTEAQNITNSTEGGQ